MTDEGRCPRCGMDFADQLGHTMNCPALAPETRALAEALFHAREATTHLLLAFKGQYGDGMPLPIGVGYTQGALRRSEEAQRRMLS